MSDPVIAPETVVTAPAVPVAPTTPIALTVEPVVVPPVVTPEVPVAADDDVQFSYDPTGDPGLDVALGFFGKLGLAAEHPAMKAAVAGEFTLLKAHLAVLGSKATGWEQMVALGEQAYARNADKVTKQATAVQTAVHAVAGGAEQWTEVQTWASANATADEKAAINAMFDAGPVQARAAAHMLMDAFRGAAGTVVNPSPATGKTSGASAPAGNAPLTPQTYSKAVQELAAKVGASRLDSHPDYIALQTRFMASRK